MKTPENIEEAVTILTETIQGAARTTTTPEPISRQTKIIPQEILEKIREKKESKSKLAKT